MERKQWMVGRKVGRKSVVGRMARGEKTMDGGEEGGEERCGGEDDGRREGN